MSKKVVFWLKKCEKFRVQQPKKFFSKIFLPTKAREKTIYTKKHLFKESKPKDKFSKILKNSQNLLSYFLVRPKFFFPFFPIFSIFFGACGASFFFFFPYWKWKMVGKNKKSGLKNFQVGPKQGGTKPENSLFFEM